MGSKWWNIFKNEYTWYLYVFVIYSSVSQRIHISSAVRHMFMFEVCLEPDELNFHFGLDPFAMEGFESQAHKNAKTISATRSIEFQVITV